MQKNNVTILGDKLEHLGNGLVSLVDSLVDKPSTQLKQLNSAPLELLASTRLTDKTGVQLAPTLEMGIYRNKSGLPQVGPGAGGRYDRQKVVRDIVRLKAGVAGLRRELEAAGEADNHALSGHDPGTVEHLVKILNKHEKGTKQLSIVDSVNVLVILGCCWTNTLQIMFVRSSGDPASSTD